MWAVRARGGVGTHWQPLNTLKTPRKCKPGVGSGQVGVGWGVGGEGAGGCGHALAAFKYSQNTYRKCKPGVGSGEAGVGWGVGGEGAGGVWARIGSL